MIKTLISVTRKNSGFTLVEMAIVMIIVTVLMGGLMAGLTSQYDARAQAQTEQTLADIREVLLGYAVTWQSLPCPATPDAPGQGSGTESTTGGVQGQCAHSYDGLVPGTTLGITPTDSRGYVLDGWGQRIHYAVTNANQTGTYTHPNAFTQINGMRTVTNMSAVPSTSNLQPNLTVCSILSSGTCAPNSTLTNNAVAVIYSTGKNWTTGGCSVDEQQNPNRYGNSCAPVVDPVFVSHAPMASTSAGGEFDDIVTWISPYTLYSRMITAGQLP